MKISLITVCYNSSSTIEKTFQSVKNQSYKNLEYIVIDGGSTDGTLRIIQKFKPYILKFISEKDQGLYDAMNKGISLASGDLIGILNSDDIFFNNNVLEDIVKFHSLNNVDASIGNILQYNKYGKKVRTYTSKNWNPNKLKIGFMPPHPSIFFKRELFEKFGNYHLDYISGADYELITRFFLKKKISWKFSNIITTKMLIGGISSSGISSYLIIYNEICRALSTNGIKFNRFKVFFRAFWKFFGFFK